MSNIVLSDILVGHYVNFKNGKITDTNLIQKLLSSIQPFLTSSMQLSQCRVERNMLMPLEYRDPLIEISNLNTLPELVVKSKLKLLLVSDDTDYGDIPKHNILQPNKSGFNYSTSLKAGESRALAIRHIKYFLADALKITIIDPYFSEDENQYSANKTLLLEIVPPNLQLEIQCKPNQYINLKQDLAKSGYLDTNIPPPSRLDARGHDRYIKIKYQNYAVQIFLSSGFYYLTNSTKELVLLVEILH